MSRTPIIAGVVGIAVLLCVTILFTVPRPSPPPITVRHVRSIQSGRWFSATFGITNPPIWLGRVNRTFDSGVTAIFEITNHTSSIYHIEPVSFEVRNGLVWKKCFAFDHSPLPLALRPHASETTAFNMTNLPTGSPLRLRMCFRKELAGLERLFMRFDLRFRQGHRNVSLNPFDKSLSVFSSKQAVILSDEFVEQEPK